VKRSIVVAAPWEPAQDTCLGIELLPAGPFWPIRSRKALDLSRTTVFGLFLGRAAVVGCFWGPVPSAARSTTGAGRRRGWTLSNVGPWAAGLVLLGVAQGFLTLALAWARARRSGMAMGLL